VRLRLLAAALLLTACQQSPALPAPAATGVSPAEQLRAEGDVFMAGGNYAGALEKFRQAIDLEPTSVPLRFVLGTAYSFLDRRPEAIAQFRWVMANAPAGSTELEESRRWLARVGALVEVAEAGRSDVAAEAATKKADPASQGSVSGQTQWSGVNPAEQRVPIKVSLIGGDEATRQVGLRRDISLGERFEFKDVPEGQYRLVGVFDDRIIWDQRITVKGGKQTDIALNQGVSSVPADTIPLAPAPTPR